MNNIKPFKVAVIQKPGIFLNAFLSLRRAEELLFKACDQGASLAVFGETWFCGYPVWLDFSDKAALWDYQPAKDLYKLLVNNAMSLGDESFKGLLKIAKKVNMHLVMGLNELKGNTLYNSMLFVDKNGEDFVIHRKLLPTYTERLIWGRGDGSTLCIFKTSDIGNVGGLICWEHWMPEARIYLHHLNELVHIAQWPTVKDLHQTASKHYAFEGQCFVISAGCSLTKKDVLDGAESVITKHQEGSALSLLRDIPLSPDEYILRGGSSVIAPDSSYLTDPLYNEKEIIYAVIHPGKAIEGRLEMDTTGHYSRPDIFQLRVNTEDMSGLLITDDIGGDK